VSLVYLHQQWQPRKLTKVTEVVCILPAPQIAVIVIVETLQRATHSDIELFAVLDESICFTVLIFFHVIY